MRDQHLDFAEFDGMMGAANEPDMQRGTYRAGFYVRALPWWPTFLSRLVPVLEKYLLRSFRSSNAHHLIFQITRRRREGNDATAGPSDGEGKR